MQSLFSVLFVLSSLAWAETAPVEQIFGHLVDDDGPIFTSDGVAEPCDIEFHKGYFRLHFLKGSSLGMLPDEERIYRDAYSDSHHDFFPLGFEKAQLMTFWVYPTAQQSGRTVAIGLVTPNVESFEMSLGYLGDRLRQFEFRHFADPSNPAPTRFYPQTHHYAPLTERRNPWGHTKTYLFVRCVFGGPTS